MTGVNIVEALDAPAMLGHAIRDPATFRSWRVVFKAVEGVDLTDDEMELFTRHTGRTVHEKRAFRKIWLCTGRRGGKTLSMAILAVYRACFADYREHLGPGEKACVLLIAADRRQARQSLRYIRGILTGNPVLKNMIDREWSDGFELSNGTVIEIATCSFRSVRGYSIVLGVCDEVCYWMADDSANPDKEVLTALMPATINIPGSQLVFASSPYARKGIMYEAYQKHYGKNDAPEFFWKADTRAMNPTVPQDFIDEAYADDPASAAAEYGADFRTDVESFVSREVLEAAIVPGRFELPPLMGVKYYAFGDPSGGSSDAMTMAICHLEGEVSVVDCIRVAQPPFSPESVVEEFAGVLKSYGLSRIVGDRYAGEWPRERFRVHGIDYDLAEKPKSDLYKEALPIFNARRVELLDHKRLIAELAGLERRVARGGRDSIDHRSGSQFHDDVANSVAGALVTMEIQSRRSTYDLAALGGYYDEGAEFRLMAHAGRWK